jgi:hypothetical protein
MIIVVDNARYVIHIHSKYAYNKLKINFSTIINSYECTLPYTHWVAIKQNETLTISKIINADIIRVLSEQIRYMAV